MELVHPMKFEERKNLSLQDQRSSIDALKLYYPFVVTDSIALEHNLSVLYNNREIKILLDRRIKERDAIVARQKARQQEAAEIAAGTTTERVDGSADSEETDTCVGQSEEVEVGLVKEGKPSLQDLLYVIKKAELKDALPEAMKVIQLPVTTPLTSVHCKRAFSRMKCIVSNTRVSMRQE